MTQLPITGVFCASVTPYAVHIESKDDFRIPEG